MIHVSAMAINDKAFCKAPFGILLASASSTSDNNHNWSLCPQVYLLLKQNVYREDVRRPDREGKRELLFLFLLIFPVRVDISDFFTAQWHPAFA